MPATGLYGTIQSQKTKTAFLFLVFMLACQAYGFALILSCVIVFHDLPTLGKLDIAWQIWRNSIIAIGTSSLLWAFIAYLFQSRSIARRVASEPASRAEEPRAYNLLENLSIATGLTMPELRVIETNALNAFTSALGLGGPVVTVTRGLLNRATDDELEAALAHQVTRIKNGDSKLIGFAMIFMGVIFRVFEFFIRPFTSFNLRTVFFLLMLPFYPLLACIVLGIVVTVGLAATLATRFAISHRRVYLADAETVDLIKGPRSLAHVLLKAQAARNTISQDDLINALCLQGPEGGWLSSHPTTLSRIETMTAYSGMSSVGTPDVSPRPSFQILPTVLRLHLSGFGAGVSNVAIIVPVILAFTAQSWLFAQFGGKLGLVKPLDDSAYVSENPYRKATDNALKAADVETRQKCFYNKTTGYIVEGKDPVQTYKTTDAELASSGASSGNPEFTVTRQFHIAGNSAIAVYGPMCAAHGCNGDAYDMFARAVFGYYMSAEAIATSFQQKSGAAGLAYARQYLNSPEDQATRQFIKQATDNKVITEYQFNIQASRLLLNDFANYRACTVDDAKAVNPALLSGEALPVNIAFSDQATMDDQIKAITQMTKAEVHHQRMNFPLILGIILFGLWLIWKVITISLRLLGRGATEELPQPGDQLAHTPTSALLISPFAAGLVALSLAFPNLAGLVIPKLGGPAVQVVSTEQDITSHSSMQDKLDAAKARNELVASYAKQLPKAIADYNSQLPADSEYRIPTEDDEPPQPQIAMADITKMEDQQACSFDRMRGYIAYGKQPLQKFAVSSEDVLATVRRGFVDKDFYSSLEYSHFFENLNDSYLGMDRRDHAYSMMGVERVIDQCLAGTCSAQDERSLNFDANLYVKTAGSVITLMAEQSGADGVRYAYEFLNSARDRKTRKNLKTWADMGKLVIDTELPHSEQLLVDGRIGSYRPCSLEDGKIFAAKAARN